jgi:hypothetical protein
VYSWIWRHLPGPLAVRAATALLLVLAAAALLLLVVFPALVGPGGLWQPTL